MNILRHARRGSALVETAFTLGFTLMLILGAIQIAVMGFFQMQLDGATFFFAHSFATGSTNVTSLNTALEPLFPNVSMNMSPNPQSPPLTNVPVNFTQWGNLNNRYGGASILRPQRLEATSQMSLGWLSVLGKSVTLSSGNVDGRSMVGNHDDDAQGIAYDSNAEYSSLVDPLTQDDQNVPPYYITLAFFWNCGDTPPWGPSCSSSNHVLRAIGLGEFLKDDNYQNLNNGIGPGATFATAACHQRILADLAQAFPATMPTYAPRNNYDQVNGPASVSSWGGASFSLVYSWDIQPVQGETGSVEIGRLYPMAVNNGCGSGQPGRMNGQRGQSIPIWAFGTLSALVLLAMALNYGSTLRWQIRAQNAADAAARGMLAVQTSQWNETMADVHAAAIEEYRLRNIMNDLLEVIQGSGGCDSKAGDSGPTTCRAMYASLRAQYMDGLQRYTNDVLLLNRLDYPSQTQQVAQIKAALQLYQQHCGTSTGGDCGFNYSLVANAPRQDGYVEDVYADCCAFAVGGDTTGNPKADLSPLKLEVVACANVQPAFPSFFKFAPQPYQAIGRAAATSIMGTQEFMYVGSLVDPITNQIFQATEYPESTTGTPLFSGEDPNYRIDYGGNPNNPYNDGNPAVSDGKWGFTYTPQNPGFLAATGWWQSMAIKPFSGQLTNGVQYTCK